MEMIISRYVFFTKLPWTCLKGAYKSFGVKSGTYAASVVERIYDYYCRGATNLYFSYLRFHRKEFVSYTEYLDKKLNLFPDEIEKVKSIFTFHKDVTFQPERNITNLTEEHDVLNTLLKFLGDEINDD
jgi:hypothetical protein